MKAPSARRRSRELAMQGVYQWLMAGTGAADIRRNLAELDDYAKADEKFLVAELEGTLARATDLVPLVEPLADRKWAEVSPVERAILLIGAWELVHAPEIPFRVTINEAIELGKRFGGTDGHKYVNGVLDRLATQVRPDEVAQTRQAKNGP